MRSHGAISLGIIAMLCGGLLFSGQQIQQLKTSLSYQEQISNNQKKAYDKLYAKYTEEKNFYENIPEKRTINCKIKKCISLTFDDGPSQYTTGLLEILKEYNVKATFFVLGSKLEDNTSILTQMQNDGHEIGNHTWTHPSLKKIQPEEIKKQISDTNASIVAITKHHPTFFRPPYGDHTFTTDSIVDMPIAMWTIDPKDRKIFDSEKIANTIIKKSHRNGIILLHDIYETSINAVPEVIKTLKKQGYTFTTLSEMKLGL